MDSLESNNNNTSNKVMSDEHSDDNVNIGKVSNQPVSRSEKPRLTIGQEDEYKQGSASNQNDEAGEEEEDSHSPSTSQVSVSSVAPTLVAALLNQHDAATGHAFYDLTPVTRNTCSTPPTQGPQAPVVSPSEEQRQQEVEDHLSLPTVTAGSTAVSNHGMRPTGRAQSATLSSTTQDNHGSQELSLRPVPIPHRQKFFSFSGREQYEEELAESAAEAVSSLDVSVDHSDLPRLHQQQQQQHQQPGLHPYQPPRDDAMEELPPEEVLGQIFATRRRQDQQSMAAVVGGESKTHRFSSSSDPQISRSSNSGDAPSLHLAPNLGTDTNASFSTHTTLNTLEDDLSAFSGGSRNPSWTAEALSRTESKSHNNPVIVEGFLPDDDVEEQAQSQRDDADTTMAIDGKYQREQAALEWLNSLPSQQIAEAASSKFLCQTTPSPAASPHRPSFTAMP